MIIERINSRFMSIYLLLCVFLATEGSLISLYAADYRGSENEQKVATAQTVKQVLDHIERNSNYVVLYSDNVLPELEKKVSVNTSGKAVTKILQELSSTTNLEYKMNDRQITVAKKSPVTAPQPQQNATIKVTGQVVDENGETIPGANVVVKGQTGIGTVTDLDGKFTLDVPQGSVLVISFIGYVTQEHSVKAREKLTVKLIPDAQALEEVVVVGYGVQKKESLTGAMQTVSSSKLKDITTPSVENMLNGKAAGVYVAPGSGQPGASGAVVIRGQVTLSGGTAPLWVIDGVIVGSSAGQLNPNDIETMTILKDASSTAIYGSEGANGVIVVTTKSGKADKMSINISTKLGISNLNNGNLEMMNGAELYDLYSSFSNSGNISFPRWNPDLRNSNFSWWDLATKTGFTQDYNISLQGGSEKLNSFVSVGVYDETGSVKGYDYTRYNFRTKTTYKPFKWLTVKPSLSGARRNITDTQYSVGSMYSMFPWDSPYDENSNLVPHRYSGWVNNTATNYLLDLSYGNKSSSRYLEFMGNFDFDIHLTDWLTLSSVNSYKLISYASESYADPRSNGGKSVQGRVTDYRWEAARRYTNQILRFNKNFDKHSIQALAAHEFKDYWSKTLDVNGTGLISGFEVLDVTSLAEKAKGGITEWAVDSYFFRGNYSYDNKYLVEASLRRDGASNFGDNAKWGNFFSISAGWNINREEWFKWDFVNNLKLRASYGTVGNRPDSLYPQYDLYSVSSSYSYDGVPGALISQIGNKDLTWEETKTIGIGLDLSMWQDRFRFTFDWYSKNTDNILYAVPISGLTGVTRLYKNVGKMQNQGFEVSIGGDIIRTKNWLWSIDANLGHNSNKLKDLFQTRAADGTYSTARMIISDNSGIAGSAQRVLEVGSPVDTYWMPEWAGVNPENGAPQWYDKNGEKTSKYADAAYRKCGTSNPKIFGGFSTVLKWKDIDFNAVFGYSLGGHLYNYSRQEYDSDGTYTDRNQMKLKDGWSRWEKAGDIATHPVASYNNSNNSNKMSSRYIEKNDFLKLRSISIGYNLQLPQYYIQNMRIFFTGENLLTFTGYSGVDPELPPKDDGSVIGTTGPSVYPSVRKFMFGVNLTF